MRYDESGQDRAKFLMIAVAIAIAMFAVYMLTFRADVEPLSEAERPLEEAVTEPETSAYAEKGQADIPFQRERELKILEEQRAGFEAETVEAEGENGLYIAPAWIRNSVPVHVPADKFKVVIIIDDLGENPRAAHEVISLDGPLTLAFLPYPSGVKELAESARAQGHEIMVHMPMEPTDRELDKGSYVLRSGMDREEFAGVLAENLKSIDGYVGINNHMGSGLTQDREAMEAVMEELAKNGLLFVDSRTIGTSIAAEIAEEYNIPAIKRDVFIDHVPSMEAVQTALTQVERVAIEHGTAVAIGHPKRTTIDALKAWLPTLEKKNIVLVPVSAVVRPDVSTMTQDAEEAEPVQ